MAELLSWRDRDLSLERLRQLGGMGAEKGREGNSVRKILQKSAFDSTAEYYTTYTLPVGMHQLWHKPTLTKLKNKVQNSYLI